jgi:hypothetical protein
MIQSAIYRTRVKRLTQLLKSVNPLLKRLLAPLPRPGSPAYPSPKVWDAKQAQARQERYEDQDRNRLDRTAAPFWLSQLSEDSDARRSRR